MSSLKQFLQSQRERIETEVQAGKEQQGFQELNDGLYIVQIIEHKAQQDKNENWGVLTKYVVLQGEYAGSITVSWDGLDREDGFKWLVVRLKASGVPSDELEVDNVMNEMAKNADDVYQLAAKKTVVKLQLKTKKGDKGEMQNKYVQKYIAEYDGDLYDPKNPIFNKKKDHKDEGQKGASAPKNEGFDIAVGMKVVFKKGVKKLTGTISSMNEEDMTVKIKDADDTVHEIGADQILEIVNEDVA